MSASSFDSYCSGLDQIRQVRELVVLLTMAKVVLRPTNGFRGEISRTFKNFMRFFWPPMLTIYICLSIAVDMLG